MCAVVRLHGDMPAAGRGGGRPGDAVGAPLARAAPAHAPLARLRQAKRRRQDTNRQTVSAN